MKTLLILSLAFYLVSLVQTILTLLQRQRLPFHLTMGATLCGFTIHTLAIVLRGLEVARWPLVIPQEVFSFLSWAIAGYYIISSFWNRNRILVGYIIPVAVLFMLVALWLPSPASTPINFRAFGHTILFPIHTSLVLFAYAAFFVTFLAGVMYILQERELKLKRFGSMFFRLPALDTCDDISYKSTSIGFVLLTFGMVTGIMWSGRHDGLYWHGDPIEIVSLLTWLIYLFMIHYRVTAGWRGRRAAIVAIIGFVFVLFSLVGLKYLGGFHVFEMS
ncbi:MAG: cytochrome c biogenesis protein CcsA [Acidobacteriota bacterium]